MARRSTTGYKVSITSVADTTLGPTLSLPLVLTGGTGAGKGREFTCGPIDEMMEIVETTSLGDSKRQRAAQGLEDLSDVEWGFLFDAETINSYTRVMRAIKATKLGFTARFEYSTTEYLVADWLVQRVGFPTDVGALTKNTCSLMSEGSWQFTGI